MNHCLTEPDYLGRLYEQRQIYLTQLGHAHHYLSKIYKKLAKIEFALVERQERNLSRHGKKKLQWTRALSNRAVDNLEAHRQALDRDLQRCNRTILSMEYYNNRTSFQSYPPQVPDWVVRANANLSPTYSSVPEWGFWGPWTCGSSLYGSSTSGSSTYSFSAYGLSLDNLNLSSATESYFDTASPRQSDVGSEDLWSLASAMHSSSDFGSPRPTTVSPANSTTEHTPRLFRRYSDSAITATRSVPQPVAYQIGRVNAHPGHGLI